MIRAIWSRHRQIFLFILAGGLSAAAEVVTFKIFSTTLPKIFPQEQEILGLHYPFSNILSTTCGIISNYFFSIWFVFSRGRHSRRREFTYFMGISALSTFISLILFQVFYTQAFIGEALDFRIFTFSGEMISKILSILTVATFNYFIKKKFIFK